MKLQGSKVLVTGGAGFVPSHVVDAFVEEYAQVTVVDNFAAGKRSNLVQVQDKIQIIDMDIRDKGMGKLIKQQDIVVHMAANADVPVSVKEPDYDFQNNVIGSYNILKACLDYNKRVIFASSAAVYGEPVYTPIDEKHPTNPRSPYGAAKLAIEKLGFAYYETFGLPFTAIRIFNTYGVRQPRYVMYDLLRKLYEDPKRLEVLGTGQQIRDYSYATDTAHCFLLTAKNDISIGQAYNVAGGNPISIAKLVTRLVETLDLKKVDISYTGISWAGDVQRLIADLSKTSADLGFQPRINLEEGINLLNTWLSVREQSKK